MKAGSNKRMWSHWLRKAADTRSKPSYNFAQAQPLAKADSDGARWILTEQGSMRVEVRHVRHRKVKP